MGIDSQIGLCVWKIENTCCKIKCSCILLVCIRCLSDGPGCLSLLRCMHLPMHHICLCLQTVVSSYRVVLYKIHVDLHWAHINIDANYFFNFGSMTTIKGVTFPAKYNSIAPNVRMDT